MATATNLSVPKSDFEDEPASLTQRIIVGVFVGVPTLALIAAIPFAWGWGLGWHDVVIAAVFYWITGLGITVGYHRYFTHGSFKAKTPVMICWASEAGLSSNSDFGARRLVAVAMDLPEGKAPTGRRLVRLRNRSLRHRRLRKAHR